jgi:acetyl esterase/lipase
MMKKTISTFVLAALAMTAAAQKVFDSPLYSGKAPHNNGDDQDTAKVRVYLPDSKVATGRAVVICPGGGYDHLSMLKEGYDWGEFLQNQGIAAIVLKYRMPHGDVDVPVSDAENAIKFVRRNASS